MKNIVKWITFIQCAICMCACVYDAIKEKMFSVVWGVTAIMYFIILNNKKDKV